jgi:acetyl-CoA acetyltransferase
MTGSKPEEIKIGIRVRADLVAVDDELTLPIFGPAPDIAAPLQTAGSSAPLVRRAITTGSNQQARQLSGVASIAGIGATEFSKASGRSELQLACEAVLNALEDCGLAPADVDGMVSFTMDTNPETEVARNVDINELHYMAKVPLGGGSASGTIMHAAMAVATGVADVVVCYRAFNERSGRRFGSGIADQHPTASAEQTRMAWVLPTGLVTPAHWVSIFAQRYLHQSGASTEDFGRVAVAARQHAATNPAAWYYERPISLADHQASRWISEPLRRLDCCQETDGAQAFVVVSAERARSLRQPPAVITAAAQGSAWDQQMMTSYYREDLATIPEHGIVARRLRAMSGLGTKDIQAAMLYDHFTPSVLMQLEEFGFCERGEAKDFVRDGHIELGGRLPVNTHGGLLGEAYLHGMNGIAEAARQVRGQSCNPVAGLEHVLVTSAWGTPTSGLILSRDA